MLFSQFGMSHELYESALTKDVFFFLSQNILHEIILSSDYYKSLYLYTLPLALFFPMFSYDTLENIRKPLMFSGGSKGKIGKKMVNFTTSA